jgi:hypothetical protein
LSQIEIQRSSLTTISPLGRRTAIASEWGERIITPSKIAWPPTLIGPSAIPVLRYALFAVKTAGFGLRTPAKEAAAEHNAPG